MKRNCLSLLRWAATAQKDLFHVINKIVAYLLQAYRLTEKIKYNPASIIAKDKTAVWADMTAPTTVETTGKKEVSLTNTGHEKVRISVCLSARAGRAKLKPFMVERNVKVKH